ncbi:MAG TPA: hypothetical protein VF763_01665 [Candidatus Limnocylindrales bacterium]
MAERPLHPINREHLDELTGELGIWQHATGSRPRMEFGYCTDDVARALVVDLLHARELGWEAVRKTAWRSLRFLRDAFDPDMGAFRNFRDADGSWTEVCGSEDSQGRAVIALGSAIGVTGDAGFADDARRLLASAMPCTARLEAPRAVSSALVGCDIALDASSVPPGLRADAMLSFRSLAATLSAAFADVDVRSDWPWPEPVLTYENALLPRALLVAGRRLDDDTFRQTGHRVLDWLLRVQTTQDGAFSPIGSDAWWRRGDIRSRFDQQPIEATATILACEEAFRQGGGAADLGGLESAYAWFLGTNDLQLPVAMVETGSCHDALTPAGVNLNQGAESTLMWLTALEHVRQVRRETAARREDLGAASSVAAVVGSAA